MEQNTENSPVSPQILKKENVSNEKPKAPNFRCEECDKDFSIETIYKKHLVTLHDLAKSVQCEQCNETFVEKDELEKHRNESHQVITEVHPEAFEETTFLCGICGQCFPTNDELNLHNNENHEPMQDDPENVNVDEEAPEKENNPDKVDEEHEKKETENPDDDDFQCSKCGLCYSNKANLKRHMMRKHNNQKRKSSGKRRNSSGNPVKTDFQCRHCGKYLSNKYNLKYHIKDNHKDEEEGINHVQIDDLNGDFQILNAKSVFECSDCDKTFENEKVLNIHFKLKHSEGAKETEHKDEDFVCEDCGETFVNVKGLKIHVGRVHKSKSIENEDLNEMNDLKLLRNADLMDDKEVTEEAFACEPCDKTFSSEQSLKIHNGVAHQSFDCSKEMTEKKGQFICNTCGKSYTTKWSMKMHFKSAHEGKKRKSTDDAKNEFFCNQCDRSFGTQKSLNLHVGIKHSNYTSYYSKKGSRVVCNECGNDFYDVSSAICHIKNLHKNLNQSMHNDDQNKLFCNHCDRSFTNQSKLNMHVGQKHSKSTDSYGKKGSRVSCLECDKDFPDYSHAIRHIKSVHESSNDSNQDKETPKYGKYTSYYSRKGSRMVCNECGKDYADGPGVVRHIKNAHMKDINDEPLNTSSNETTTAIIAAKISYQCLKCNLILKYHDQVVKHLEQVHNVSRSQCDNFISELISEIPDPNETATIEFSCDTCDKTFDTSFGLKVHVLRMHGKVDEQKEKKKNEIPEKPLENPNDKKSENQCIHCAKYYSNKWNLKAHIKQVHKNIKDDDIIENDDLDDTPMLEDVKGSKPKEPEYQCQMCDKYFDLRIGLKKHISNIHRIPYFKVEDMISKESSKDTKVDKTDLNSRKRKASEILSNMFDPRVKIRKLTLADILTRHTLKLT